MRYAILGMVLVLAACEGPATTAHKAYQACLAEKPAGQCTNERERFDAAITYADAQSRRLGARRAATPVVVESQPVYTAPRQPVICNTVGGSAICN